MTRNVGIALASILLMGLTSCKESPTTTSGFSLVIGSRGSTSGHFDRPRGIVHAPTLGTIFVIDWDGRIQQFTTNGHFRSSWIMPDVEIGKPEDLCMSKNGTILVTDTHYSRIIEFSTDGEVINRFGEYGREPGQFIYPVGISCDTNGNIYVSEYGESDRIQVFTANGEFLRSWGKYGTAPGEFMRPSGIDVGPDNTLYVADAVNHRIQVFSLEGDLLRIIGQDTPTDDKPPLRFKYPYDVLIKDDTLYVLEYGAHRVAKLTLEGEPLATFGTPGRDDGQLSSPWRFGHADHSLFVSDTMNYRVVKIEF